MSPTTMKTLLFLGLLALASCCDYNYITDGFWLGGINGTTSNCLSQASITAVVTVREDPINYTTLDHYVWIYAKDEPNQQLYDIFSLIHTVMRSWHQDGHNILIHCHGGHSRSATVLASYLMRHFTMDATDTLSFMDTKREIHPNKGFLQQLWVYDFFNHSDSQFYPDLQATLWPKNATLHDLK